MRPLNHEKLVFAGTLLALGLASGHALTSRPELRDVGTQRVALASPTRLRLAPASAGVLDLSGERNPFASWSPRPGGGSSAAGEGAPDGGTTDAGGKEEIVVPFPDVDTGPVEPVEFWERPRPYEVPASFRGVHRPSGGRWRVVLEAKRDGEYRSLFAGDAWPDLNLRILRISSSSVLLEDGEGRRFLMRVAGHGRTTSDRSDSARAGSGT
jgi:hypothetical protein